MRGQPLPDLTSLDARVILDLLTDLESRLAGHDVSTQVNFVTNRYKEVASFQVLKFNAMITLHYHLQPQYKYEFFHINFTLYL